MPTAQIVDSPTDRKAVQAAAGRKAAETRRRNAATKACGTALQILPAKFEPKKRSAVEVLPPVTSSAAKALAAFDRMAASDSPDWHAAALLLKSALADGGSTRFPKTRSQVKQVTPKALPAPAWPDYDVTKAGARDVRNPTIVVTFADGEVVRAPAVSIKGKPTNIGRGLRTAIAFYQARMCHRFKAPYLAGIRVAVPSIAACACPEKSETFEPELCTAKTIDARKPAGVPKGLRFGTWGEDVRVIFYRRLRRHSIPAMRAWDVVNGRAA